LLKEPRVLQANRLQKTRQTQDSRPYQPWHKRSEVGVGCTETDSPTPPALELNRSVTLTQRIRTNLASSKRRARVAVLGHRELITINTSGAEAIACARRRARHTEASIAVAVGATLVCVELRRIRATRTIGTDTSTSGGAASAHILSRVTNFHGLHTHTHTRRLMPGMIAGQSGSLQCRFQRSQ
jgi:hypothetical protein